MTTVIEEMLTVIWRKLEYQFYSCEAANDSHTEIILI